MEQLRPEGNAGNNDEISLKDLILKVQQWIQYLIRKWYLIVLAGIIGAGIGLTIALLKKDKYVAVLTFVMEENKSSPLGAYAGLASQFGIDMGGASGSGVFSGENIMGFLKSRLMVEKALLSTITVDNRETTLAEMYINIYEWRNNWKGKPSLEKIHFTPGMDTMRLNRQQDSLLLSMYNNLVSSQLEVAKPDKKLGFLAVKCTSVSELFSKIFVERLVKEATDFYVKTKTKRSKASVDRLQAKADSLEFLLNKKTYAVAMSQDLNLNPVRNIARVGTEMGMRDKMVLQTMYGEVVKNLELSRMSMSQETPIIQVIDVPVLPLEKLRFGKLKGLIMGGMIAGFLCVLLLLVTRLYKQIIA